MPELDLNTYASELKNAYDNLIRFKSSTTDNCRWTTFGYEAVRILKPINSGSSLDQLVIQFKMDSIMYALLKLNSKYMLIGWCGEKVQIKTKMWFNYHLNDFSERFITIKHDHYIARTLEDLSLDEILNNFTGRKDSGSINLESPIPTLNIKSKVRDFNLKSVISKKYPPPIAPSPQKKSVDILRLQAKSKKAAPDPTTGIRSPKKRMSQITVITTIASCIETSPLPDFSTLKMKFDNNSNGFHRTVSRTISRESIYSNVTDESELQLKKSDTAITTPDEELSNPLDDFEKVFNQEITTPIIVTDTKEEVGTGEKLEFENTVPSILEKSSVLPEIDITEKSSFYALSSSSIISDNCYYPSAIALLNYPKSNEAELNLEEGEPLEDIETMDNEWFLATNKFGQRGLVPASYIQLNDSDSDSEDEDQDDVYDEMSPIPCSTVHVIKEKDKDRDKLIDEKDILNALVQIRYNSTKPYQLNLCQGDIVKDVEIVDDDWWLGTLSNQRKMFPSNYASLIWT